MIKLKSKGFFLLGPTLLNKIIIKIRPLYKNLCLRTSSFFSSVNKQRTDRCMEEIQTSKYFFAFIIFIYLKNKILNELRLPFVISTRRRIPFLHSQFIPHFFSCTMKNKRGGRFVSGLVDAHLTAANFNICRWETY